jgi:DNA primase
MEIDEIKDRIKLSDYVKRFVFLRQKGLLFWGNCPFHMEKTPSFSVNDQKKIFHCFGCGEGGDIFNFIEKKENKTFREAYLQLAEELGIKVKTLTNKNYKLILQDALNHYKQNKQMILEYLKNRNFNEEIIETFQLGFALNNELIDDLLTKYSVEDLNHLGISVNGFDRFRNRLMIPIMDRKGQVIGFSGRTMENNSSIPKYINSIESVIFHKNLHLYGENNLQTNEPIFIVEGYFDVIRMYSCNYKNTVALMGTALNAGHLFSLFGLTNEIFIMFDGDNAGRRALENSLTYLLGSLKPGKIIKIIELPFNEDPDSFLNMKKNLNEYIENSLELSTWIIQNVFKNLNKDSIQSQTMFLQKIDDLLNSINNKIVKQVFQNRFYFYYKNLKKTNFLNVKKPTEESLISFLLNHLEFSAFFIEEIANINFKSKEIEKIHLFLLQQLVEESNYDNIHENILRNFNFHLEKTNKFQTREAFLNYLKDVKKLI